ncbi:MAG TPA: hypothetical protein VK213_13070 [Bacteroidales bacterium]|nr:hypothetical protein [Bacteroidales bacterium]
MKKILLSLMLIAGIYALANGQQGVQSQSTPSANDPNWVKIGEKTVDLSMDHGVFNWNTDREKTVNADQKYSAIKFRAKDAPVSLTRVEVAYEDGKKQDLDINTPVQVDMESKVITLNSQSELEKITFNFAKNESARDDKAKIEVWGLKSNTSSGMGQRNSEDQGRIITGQDQTGINQGNTQSGSSRSGMESSASSNDANWVKIGEKSVDLSASQGIFNWKTDREKTVNADQKYSAIKFKAKDAPVNLTKVEVAYEDGKKQDLDINTPVKVDMESKVITLNSQSELEKITFNYAKDQTARDEKAKIEVWGLKSNTSSGMGQRNSEDKKSSVNSDQDRSGINQGNTQSGSNRSTMDKNKKTTEKHKTTKSKTEKNNKNKR